MLGVSQFLECSFNLEGAASAAYLIVPDDIAGPGRYEYEAPPVATVAPVVVIQATDPAIDGEWRSAEGDPIVLNLTQFSRTPGALVQGWAQVRLSVGGGAQAEVQVTFELPYP